MFRKDSSLSPNDGSNNKRSSFSLSGTVKSLKRAASTNKDKNSKSSSRHEKDTEAHAENPANTNPFADPPPAYTVTTAEGSGEAATAGPSTPISPAPSSSFFSRSRTSKSKSNTASDPFACLGRFDTVFLIDDSFSMKNQDGGERGASKSRWVQTREVIEQIIPVCMRYDQDGVDIYFLNDPYHLTVRKGDDEESWSQEGDSEEGTASFGYIGVTDPKAVKRIFDQRTPDMGTPTGKRLGEIMKTYVDCYESRAKGNRELPKPLNVIVITDGEATDPGDLQNNLTTQARRLDKLGAPYHQLGVQFFQVGKDNDAARHLRQLDDDLGKFCRHGELRDIVDCITHDQLSKEGGSLTSDVVLKVVIGAVDKRIDNKHMKEGMLLK